MNYEIANTINKKRVWGFWSTAGFGLALLVISFIIQVIIAVIFIVVNIINNRTADFSEVDYWELYETIDLGLLISLSVIISAVICTGILLLFIKTRRGATIADYLGLKPFGIWTLLVALAVSIAYIAISSLVHSLLESSVDTDVMVEAYTTTAWSALFWMAVVVFAPVFEEVLFRGFLFEGFRNSRAGVTGAVILTSLLWAGSHLQYQIFDITSIFALGIILGIVRYRTGSLWIPLIMHGFNNLLAVLFLAL